MTEALVLFFRSLDHIDSARVIVVMGYGKHFLVGSHSGISERAEREGPEDHRGQLVITLKSISHPLCSGGCRTATFI